MAFGLRRETGLMNDRSMCGEGPGVYEFIRLIDLLVQDILHLEAETVRTRYELSRYLPHPYDDNLRGEIVSDLSGRYSDDPAYQLYMKLMYNSQDPMESDKWVSHINNLAHGLSDNLD